MKNPLPPSFPVEEESFEAAVKRIQKPIFDKVLKEIDSNRMSVGGLGLPFVLYRPHNVRRWIDFLKEKFSVDVFKEPGFKGNDKLGSFISYGTKNWNSEHLVKFSKYNFVVKKKTIEIYLKEFSKKEFDVPVTDKGWGMVKRINRDADQESIFALKSFMELVGGASSFVIKKRESEDKFISDMLKYVDVDSRWDSPVAKKVYHDKILEFKNPIFLANFAVAAGVRTVSKDIADAIMDLCMSLKLSDPLRYLKGVIGEKNDLILYEDLIKILHSDELFELSEWTFNNLCN